MSIISKGAYIGFMVGLFGGFGWASSIYPSLDLDGIEYLLPFILNAGAIIGVLSILGAVIGAIIGYYAGSTSSKKN